MNEKLFRRYFIISVIMCAVIIAAFVFLNIKFSTGSEPWLDGSAWASIVIGAISASSTVFLGLVSHWQNKKQREDNEKVQRKLEQQAVADKREFERQRKMDVEIRHMEAYKNRLLAIDERRIDFNIINEFHTICLKIRSLKNTELSTQEINELLFLLDKKVASIIIFLNHMQNTTLYNQYYISDVEELVLCTVRVRKGIERFGLKYLNCNIFDNDCIDNETIDAYKKDGVEMIKDISRLDSLWVIYMQTICRAFETIEYNGNLEELNQILKNNIDKTQKLREKVLKIEGET